MKRLVSRALVAVVAAGCLTSAAQAAEGQASDAKPTLVSVEKISDKAPHSAFTDLKRFDNQWVCAFREAPKHDGGVQGSSMRVLTSADGKSWESAASFVDPRGDIRDAKMAVMPDGRLMLLTAIQLYNPDKQSHQSIAWYTKDLKTWDGPHDVGQPNMWMWGIKWHKGAGYSIGYSTRGERFVRLYKTTDGMKFEPLVDRLPVPVKFPNENAIAFDDKDDTAYLVLRCDPDNAFVGTAKPPYTDWSLKQTATRFGGPALTFTPDGKKLLAAGRLYDKPVRTALCWVDPAKATLTECLTFPSGGDTSYPGLVWHEGMLWVSYYSTHEGKTSIYLAHVRVPQGAGDAASASTEAK